MPFHDLIGDFGGQRYRIRFEYGTPPEGPKFPDATFEEYKRFRKRMLDEFYAGIGQCGICDSCGNLVKLDFAGMLRFHTMGERQAPRDCPGSGKSPSVPAPALWTSSPR